MYENTKAVAPRLRRPRLQALFPMALLLLAACSETQARSTPEPPAPPPQIRVTPADGATSWKPDKPLEISVRGGRLTSVSVRNADGQRTEGELKRGSGTWTSRWPLHADSTYRVRSVAVNTDGRRTTKRTTFTTADPESTFRVEAINAADATYGVGMPIIVQFTDPIDNKKAVERAMELRTSEPVTGAWHWMNDEEVHFRPKEYWTPGTKVHLIAHMNGVRAGPGMYGDDASLSL